MLTSVSNARSSIRISQRLEFSEKKKKMNVIIIQCLLTRLRYLREIVRKQGRTQEERGKGAKERNHTKGDRKDRERDRMTDNQRDTENHKSYKNRLVENS